MELEAGEDDTGLTFEGEKEGVGVGGDLIACQNADCRQFVGFSRFREPKTGGCRGFSRS